MAPKSTKSQNPPKFDVLDYSHLSSEYQFLVPLIWDNPDLRSVWINAANNGWSESRIGLAFQNTNWWKQNNKYARKAWAEYQLSQKGQSADWALRNDQARALLEEKATQMGARLSEEDKADLVHRIIYEGLDQPERQLYLERALSDKIKATGGGEGPGGYRGSAGNFIQNLRERARQNGLQYSDGWYQAAAQSVARSDTTEDDWYRDIQEKAASMFPVFGDQIRGGATAYDLASPYINLMAQTLELAPDAITLDDPYIRQALGGYDDKGKPQAMNLWDFQRRLRNDPRWMNTNFAQNQITGVADAMMQMFGLRG